MKYIRIASDLHLEAFSNQTKQLAEIFLPPDEKDAESVLILAGDISSKSVQLIDFVTEIATRFERVLVIPGNHEFYKNNYYEWAAYVSEALDKLTNVIFSGVSVKCVEIDSVRFIIGTLWGDGGRNAHEQQMVEFYLNDFRLITINDHIFKIGDMMRIHQEQKGLIEKAVRTAFNGITVVATHHMPSYELCHPRFGSMANGGFASDCDELLWSDNAPALWVSGHTHDDFDQLLGKTRMVCNPRGYRGEWDTEFNNYHSKFISISELVGENK